MLQVSKYDQFKWMELGLTLIDFIALPARARISISYSGDVGAEGFLGLRKL